MQISNKAMFVSLFVSKRIDNRWKVSLPEGIRNLQWKICLDWKNFPWHWHERFETISHRMSYLINMIIETEIMILMRQEFTDVFNSSHSDHSHEFPRKKKKIHSTRIQSIAHEIFMTVFCSLTIDLHRTMTMAYSRLCFLVICIEKQQENEHINGIIWLVQSIDISFFFLSSLWIWSLIWSDLICNMRWCCGGWCWCWWWWWRKTYSFHGIYMTRFAFCRSNYSLKRKNFRPISLMFDHNRYKCIAAWRDFNEWMY